MKKNVSVDLCQGEGCICFDIKRKKPQKITNIQIYGLSLDAHPNAFGAPPPTISPMTMMVLAHEERRREMRERERGRILGAYLEGRRS